MKKSLLYDITFIIGSMVILLGIINLFGNLETLGKYSMVVAIAGYFIGKAVKGYEIKKKEE